MSDADIQNVADIDQPAELEGVRLNWGPPEFVETRNCSYYLRTAIATSEFWEVWKQNKAALKAAGISCDRQPEGQWEVKWWIDVSGLTSITPGNDICIPEDKSYTLGEVIDLVQQTLDKVKEQPQHSELQYSSVDVYWLLYDMLRYVNQNVSGLFVLGQIKKDTYRVKHMSEDFAKQRSSRKLKAEVNRTARYLEELTGRRPPWGDKK